MRCKRLLCTSNTSASVWADDSSCTRVDVGVEWWVTHTTFPQETAVCIPCKTKHHQSLPLPNQVVLCQNWVTAAHIWTRWEALEKQKGEGVESQYFLRPKLPIVWKLCLWGWLAGSQHTGSSTTLHAIFLFCLVLFFFPTQLTFVYANFLLTSEIIWWTNYWETKHKKWKYKQEVGNWQTLQCLSPFPQRLDRHMLLFSLFIFQCLCPSLSLFIYFTPHDPLPNLSNYPSALSITPWPNTVT